MSVSGKLKEKHICIYTISWMCEDTAHPPPSQRHSFSTLAKVFRPFQMQHVFFNTAHCESTKHSHREARDALNRHAFNTTGFGNLPRWESTHAKQTNKQHKHRKCRIENVCMKTSHATCDMEIRTLQFRTRKEIPRVFGTSPPQRWD